MLYQFLNLFSFIATIAVNFGTIKGFGPFHSITNISNTFNSIITPPNWTFSIWGLIYLFLLIFVISSFILNKNVFQPIINNIGSLFTISCILNILWLLVFSVGLKSYILASVFVIVALLLTLTMRQVRGNLFKNEKLSTKHKIAKIICIDIPFSLYLGWIIFATIANVGTCLSAWNIDKNDILTYMILFIIASFMYILNLSIFNNVVVHFVFMYVICGFLIKFTGKNTNNSLLFKFTFGIGLFSLVCLVSRIIIDIIHKKNSKKKKINDEKNLYTPIVEGIPI